MTTSVSADLVLQNDCSASRQDNGCENAGRQNTRGTHSGNSLTDLMADASTIKYGSADHLYAGRLDARPLDDDRLDEGRRIANHPIAGHRIAGHRDAGHRDAGHRDAGHLDGNGGVISYRDANHRNTSYRDAGHQKVVDRVASSRVRALYQLTLAVGIFIAALAPAQAQLFGGDNEARQAILDLRQELSNLRSESQRGRMQLASQIEQLQNQLAQVRGQIETLTKQVADSKQAQRDLYMDIAERQSGPSQPGALDAGALLDASSDEQAAYDNAIDLFRKGDYKGAAQQLSSFMSKYPDGALAPTAQFYLGSSSYAQKEYKSAITQLQTMVKKWPQNQRAPDALLVIAGSQIELRNYDGAKNTLQRIIREYPDSPAAATARERLELL